MSVYLCLSICRSTKSICICQARACKQHRFATVFFPIASDFSSRKSLQTQLWVKSCQTPCSDEHPINRIVLGTSGRFHCNCVRNIPNKSEMHRNSGLWAARHSVGSSFPVVRSHTTSRNARKRALDGERRLYIWAWGYKAISITIFYNIIYNVYNGQ